MKRRNFITTLASLPFIPIAAKAVEEEPVRYVLRWSDGVTTFSKHTKDSVEILSRYPQDLGADFPPVFKDSDRSLKELIDELG